ncbi:MAG: hypothetical protein WAW92_03865 [Minisyncoccia bacterium]
MSNWFGLLIIFGIIFFGVYGGATNNGGLFKPQPLIQFPTTTESSNTNDVYEISYPEEYDNDLLGGDASQNTENISNNGLETVTDPSKSKYSGNVSISNISISSNPAYEYVQIQTTGNASTSIPITGWTLKSLSSGQSVSIPKATYLFFADSQNVEDNIVLGANEKVILITGYSPNGASFRINKCSGYLSQFQTFRPSLPYTCPAPRNEDLSSIPKTLNNDDCFDHIYGMPSCRIQTETIPANWSYECTNFIYSKINYPSCINIHKKDKDFYKGDWRIYLKRNARLWKESREKIVLYDSEGKPVSEYEY